MSDISKLKVNNTTYDIKDPNATKRAFSDIKIGNDTVASDSKEDMLELAAGDNISLSADTENDKVTISAADTTYTFAGGTNKITVTPSGGTAQDYTITPSITRNVTGAATWTTADSIVITNAASKNVVKQSGKTIETILSPADDTKVPTSKAVADYVENQIVNATHYKGGFNANTTDGTIDGGSDTLKSVAEKIGDIYTATTAGTYLSKAFDVGDSIIFKADVAAGTSPTSADITFVQGTVKVVNGQSDLAWDTDIIVGTVEGVNITAKLPANPNTDETVRQSPNSDNKNYEVLFSGTDNNDELTEGAKKNNNLKFNPSTGNLQATKLNGVNIGSSPKFTDNNSATLQVSDVTNGKINTSETTSNYIQFAGGIDKITIKDKNNASFDVGITPSTTKVTLNGEDKGGSTASLYAPTSAGTAGQVLTSSGNSAPVWKTGETIHISTSNSGTAGSTASGAYNRTQWTGTVDGITALYTGLTVLYKIPVAGISRGTSLNINNLGEHPVVVNATSYNMATYPVDSILFLVYDADQSVNIYVNNVSTAFTGCWKISDKDTTYTNQSLGNGYGICDTAEATAAKIATLSSYSLVAHGFVSIKFTYAVPANATLNINSKGAKNIFYKGAKITAGIIKAGDIATFVYDGTQYQLVSLDKNFPIVTTDLPNSGVTAGTYRSATVNAQGLVTAGTNPTTLSGYGITDAKIANGVITLGSNTITPLTSHAKHKLTASNGTASVVSQGTEITYVESVGGTDTATSGDLTVSTVRKKITVPANTNTARLQVSDTTNKKINTKESTGDYIQFSTDVNKKNTFTISDKTSNNSFDVEITPSVTVSQITDFPTDLVTKSSTTGLIKNDGSIDTTTYLSSHAKHKLTASNGTASAVSQGTEITYVESVSGTNTATSGDLAVSTTRKKITVPSIPADVVTGSGLTANTIILGNDNSAIKTSNKYIETTLSTTSDAKIPTSKAVATYVGGLMANATHFKGGFNANTTNGTIDGGSTTLKSVAEEIGDMYTVTTAGTYLGTAFDIGDSIIFKTAVAAGTAPTASNVTIVQGTVKVENKSATLAWNSAVTIATVEGESITATLPSNPNTDTKVTSAANHYTPSTASGSDKSATASGATAAWGIDVVKGVTLNTDGKGHVTGVSVTSGKIPSNPIGSINPDNIVTTTETLTANSIIVGNGNKAVKKIDAGTAGQVLTSNGSGAPTWKTGETIHVSTSNSGTAGSTASGSYNRTQWTGTCDGVTTLYDGLTIQYKIPIAGVSKGDSLNINTLGEHPVVLNTNSIMTTHYPVGSVLILVYDSTQKASIYVNNVNTEFTGCWKISDKDTTYTTAGLGFGYGICDTAAATAAKTATLSSYALTTNGIVAIKFANDVPANATLSINSKTAKNIFYRGAKITAGIIKAGDIATFVYDGTQYQFIAKDRDDDTIPNDAILTIQKNSSTVATFSANASTDVTANITVPTKTSDLTNDSGYVTTSNNTHKITVISGKKSDGTTNITATSSSSATTPSVTLGASGATAAGYGDTSNQTPSYGDTFKVPYVKINDQGIVTDISEHTVKVPDSEIDDTQESLTSTYSSSKIVDLINQKEDSRVYGFIEHLNATDPSDRIEYIETNKHYDPITVDKTNHTYDLGDWKDFKWLVDNVPWMVHSDGSEDYRLKETDYTKKLDDTASDVSNASYDGGAFSWADCIYKQETNDGVNRIVKFCMTPKEGFEPVGFVEPDGRIVDGRWIPMFYGSVANSKAQCIAGTTPKGNITCTDANWYSGLFNANARTFGGPFVETLIDLMMMFAKTTDSQTAYGSGNTGTGATILANAVVGGGQFYGTTDGVSLNKIFHSIVLGSYQLLLWDPYEIIVNGRLKVSTNYIHSPSAGTNYVDTGKDISNGTKGHKYPLEYFTIDGYGSVPNVNSTGGSTALGVCDSTYVNSPIPDSKTIVCTRLGRYNTGNNAGCRARFWHYVHSSTDAAIGFAMMHQKPSSNN